MFETIPQIHQLMQLIDKCNLQEKVFEHILRRCCHVISHNDDITGDEYAKFRNVLGLNDSETKMITSTLNSILQECIYYVAKPNLVLEVSYVLTLKYNRQFIVIFDNTCAFFPY